MLLTRSILRTYRVPEPESGVKSFEKADTRTVLIVPGPLLIMLDETFQLTAVSPEGEQAGAAKLTLAES